MSTLSSTQILNEIVSRLTEQLSDPLSAEEMFTLLFKSFKWRDTTKRQSPVCFDRNWSNWIGENNSKHVRDFGGKNAPRLKKDLEETLDLPSDLWTMEMSRQQKILDEKITCFISKLNGNDTIFEFSQELFATTTELDAEQKKLFFELQTLSGPELSLFIERHTDIFSKSATHQPLLLKMVDFFYLRGEYDHLVDDILPNLFDEHLLSTEIQLIKAHALGFHSDKARSEEAAYILHKLSSQGADEERRDRITAFISNMRRKVFEQTDPKRIDLETLKKYTRLYESLHDYGSTSKRRHYYPAINFAYMVALGQSLFPKEKSFAQYSVQEIHKEALLSLQDGAKSLDTEERYYAQISEWEFKLLEEIPSNHSQVLKKEYLDKVKPPVALIKRSLRQIQTFHKMLHPQDRLFESSNTFVKSLQDYIVHREDELSDMLKSISESRDLETMLKRLIEIEEALVYSEERHWIDTILSSAEAIAEDGLSLARVAVTAYRIKGASRSNAKSLFEQASIMEQEVVYKEASSEEQTLRTHKLLMIAKMATDTLDDTQLRNALFKAAYESADSSSLKVQVALDFKAAGGTDARTKEWLLSGITAMDDSDALAKAVERFIRLIAHAQPLLLEKIRVAQERIEMILILSEAVNASTLIAKDRFQEQLLKNAVTMSDHLESLYSIEKVAQEMGHKSLLIQVRQKIDSL